MPKCKYCGKEYSWEEAKKLEETLKGCRFYCSLEHCWLAHPNPEKNLKCPCF
jgi:hypothetical protein